MGIISARSVISPYCTVLVPGKKLSENRDHHKIYCKRSVRTGISASIQILNPRFRILLAWDEYQSEASTEEKDNNNKKYRLRWLSGWLAPILLMPPVPDLIAVGALYSIVLCRYEYHNDWMRSLLPINLQCCPLSWVHNKYIQPSKTVVDYDHAVLFPLHPGWALLYI